MLGFIDNQTQWYLNKAKEIKSISSQLSTMNHSKHIKRLKAFDISETIILASGELSGTDVSDSIKVLKSTRDIYNAYRNHLFK